MYTFQHVLNFFIQMKQQIERVKSFKPNVKSSSIKNAAICTELKCENEGDYKKNEKNKK